MLPEERELSGCRMRLAKSHALHVLVTSAAFIECDPERYVAPWTLEVLLE